MIYSCIRKDLNMDFAGKLQQRILRSHVRAAEKGMTAAEYLASHYSRFDLEGWRQAIAKGMVRLNGGSISPDTVLKEHDCVAFRPGDLPEPEADLNYSILYCDTDIAVLDKSGDLCVHPTGPFFRNTLWHIAGQKARLPILHPASFFLQHKNFLLRIFHRLMLRF